MNRSRPLVSVWCSVSIGAPCIRASARVFDVRAFTPVFDEPNAGMTKQSRAHVAPSMKKSPSAGRQRAFDKTDLNKNGPLTTNPPVTKNPQLFSRGIAYSLYSGNARIRQGACEIDSVL